MVDAFISEAWLRTVHPDSQADMLQRIGPYILSDLEERGRDFREILPEPLVGLAEYLIPKECPDVVSFTFQYIDPRPDAGLPGYPGQRLLHEAARGSRLRLRDSAPLLHGDASQPHEAAGPGR